MPSGTANDQRIAANLVQFAINETSVVCSGAPDPFEASPFSYRFWAEIAPHEEDADAPASARARRPASDRARRLAARRFPSARHHPSRPKLRLRWGAAGLTFSACEAQNYQRPNEAIFAHARRFSGYDVAEYVLLAKAFYDRLRTVSWLTWLGPSMLEDLRLRGGLGGSRLSTQTAFGDGVLLQAGGAPEAGGRQSAAAPGGLSRGRRARATHARVPRQRPRVFPAVGGSEHRALAASLRAPMIRIINQTAGKHLAVPGEDEGGPGRPRRRAEDELRGRRARRGRGGPGGPRAVHRGRAVVLRRSAGQHS
jgi:hypothetical protein